MIGYLYMILLGFVLACFIFFVGLSVSIAVFPKVRLWWAGRLIKQSARYRRKSLKLHEKSAYCIRAAESHRRQARDAT